MSLHRNEKKKTLEHRISIVLMAGGIVLLLAVLVGAFVLVPVFLVQSFRRADAQEEEGKERASARAPLEEKKPLPKPAGAPKPAASESPKPPPSADPPAPLPSDARPPDPEGFIRDWLVLAPIRSAQHPFSGAVEVNKAQLRNEAGLRPKEGDRVALPEKERVWQKVVSPAYFVDFRKLVGAGRSDDAIAYAVCYVHAPQALSGLKLQMGSNDQAKVYLNGAQLLVFDKTRVLARDQNTANDVRLQKGENLLVFKVVNEKGGWEGCIRFTDRSNQPVKNLQISLVPQ